MIVAIWFLLKLNPVSDNWIRGFSQLLFLTPLKVFYILLIAAYRRRPFLQDMFTARPVACNEMFCCLRLIKRLTHIKSLRLNHPRSQVEQELN